MNASSRSISSRHPAATSCPPTSTVVSGCSPLSSATVFSSRCLRFLPFSPTILAETLSLSSVVYAIAIITVPVL